MKTLNKKLISTIFLTLLLGGCMPDSLTKFKKDPPQKEVPASTVEEPVVDDDGTAIAFDESTFFLYSSVTTTTESAGGESTVESSTTPGDPVYISTGTAATLAISIDGSLGDSEKSKKFFERCDLMTTGVNSEAATLPAGLSLNTSTCEITGTPTTPKSVVTSFCSNGVSADQSTCEASPLVWNSTTSTCSNPSLAYATQTACLAGFNTWYANGNVVPYRIRLKYHNAEGVQKVIYTTLPLGVYKPLTALSYSQSDKVLMKVSQTSSTPPYLNSIVPLLTSTATVGAYASSNMITSSTNVYGVAKFVDVNQDYIGVNKLLPIRVASTTPFAVNTFVTKQGNANYVGKIFKIDAANRILYVENFSSSNRYFVAGDRLCSNSITGVCGTSYLISSIDENYTYKIDNKLDNDKQYYSQKFKVINPTNVYEVGSTIKPLRPIATTEISSTNGLSYSISPALPCNDPADPTDCVSLDSSTGEITGTFTSILADTEFTITATNPKSEISASFNISAVIAPSNLSYTNKQIITVASNAAFIEGETVIQPISPPLVDAITGRVLKKIGTNRMAIETFNGVFSENASLDNNNTAYQAEKTFILPYSSCSHTNYTTQASCEGAGYAWAPAADVHYNLALVKNNIGGYVAGDLVASIAGTGLGAFGRVVHVDTGATDTLYVQYLTGTSTATASAKTFYEDDTLNAGGIVNQVQNGTMLVTLASAASFIKGSDIVSNNGAAAYTNAVSGNILSLSEISKTTTGTYFEKGQTLFNHESSTIIPAPTSSAITAVTHNNYFIFERGKKMAINAAIGSGSGLLYSISPALPSGLTINSLTGAISGTATSASIKKDYIITATNFTGSTTHVVAFEVKDFFEISEKTGAPSAIMHKVGEYQVNRKCRVDATDINDLSNVKALDIRCFLDMEEEELHETDLKFLSSSGAGLCAFIQVEPYNFQHWRPLQTASSTNITTTSGCAVQTDIPAAAQLRWVDYTPTSETSCSGNYTLSDGPNCDEGSFTVTNYVGTDADDDGICETVVPDPTTTVQCAGTTINCLGGPVTDLLTPTQLDNGYRSLIYSTSSGGNVSNTFKSPNSKLLNSNLSVANSTMNNLCTTSNADADSWQNLANSTSNILAPHGQTQPFYTFNCLDGAKDIKARIRLVVRDWNKTFKIDSGIYLDLPGALPFGASLMNNVATDFGKNNNDYYDWDDAYNGAAANFTGGSCAVRGAGAQYQYPEGNL